MPADEKVHSGSTPGCGIISKKITGILIVWASATGSRNKEIIPK